MAEKNEGGLAERLKIQEKALQTLADMLRQRDARFDEQMQDALEEIKALKLFLSRTAPDFKKQFPDIRKKIKAA